MSPHTIIWVLWQERNSRVFKEESSLLEKLIQSIKDLVWCWNTGVLILIGARIEEVMFDWQNVLFS